MLKRSAEVTAIRILLFRFAGRLCGGFRWKHGRHYFLWTRDVDLAEVTSVKRV